MATNKFPDVFEPGLLVTLRYKKEMNLRITEKLQYLLGEIKQKGNYLKQHWYSAKYMVHALHGSYLLLYKILKKYGNTSMATKGEYHNLVYGPRPFKENLKIFSELCYFVSIQIDFIVAQLRFYLNVCFQDTLTQLLFRLAEFMEKVIWYENSWTGVFIDGLPVKLNWL